METTQSTAERAGIVGHALTALGHHIATYHLPEPGSIEVEHDHLEFHIAGDDAAVWAASLGQRVDAFTEEKRDNGIAVCRAEGRLPDSGVAVVIEWLAFGVGRSTVLRAVAG